jgi:hypothetical protein
VFKKEKTLLERVTTDPLSDANGASDLADKVTNSN